MIKSKKQMFIVIAIFAFIIILGGTTYAWFNYRREGAEQRLIAGNIYLTFNENNDGINLTNIFPETKEEARSRNDNYLTFEINGLNESNKTLYYEIDINHGSDRESPYERFLDEDLRFDLVELDSNGNEVKYLLNAVSYDELINKKIWVDEIASGSSTEVSRKYKLRMWLSDEVLISDSDPNRDYYATGYKNHYANIRLTVIGDFNEKMFGFQKVQKAILAKQNAETNSCNPIWTDPEDGIIYFSGTNECVDMNYVWYSGKLWRITDIYPDGRMKLVTQKNITTINWGNDIEYDGSWIYQWLNEDFYDTLVNPNSIVDSTSIWNYSIDGNNNPVRPETIATQKTKVAPIGILSVYEYYNGYRCIESATCTGSSYNTGYLNNGYYWWLITPYSNSYVFFVHYNGELNNSATSLNSFGVRPSIVIKSGIEFTGNGTKINPYKIVGDRETAVNNTTLLNSRSVGEYVNFDDDLYRIVDTTNGITKLTKVDYLRDNGTAITKNFASTVYYGRSTNTQNDTYWDYYLNNTWYNSISTDYKNMLVDGIYYLGLSSNSQKNYKATLCKDADLDIVTTANCTRYTLNDTYKIWTGKVGLPRIGEMFSSQLGIGAFTSDDIWTITPYSTSSVHELSNFGSEIVASPGGLTYAVRPSITLKSTIKITGGTGMENDPFEISE